MTIDERLQAMAMNSNLLLQHSLDTDRKMAATDRKLAALIERSNRMLEDHDRLWENHDRLWKLYQSN